MDSDAWAGFQVCRMFGNHPVLSNKFLCCPQPLEITSATAWDVAPEYRAQGWVEVIV